MISEGCGILLKPTARKSCIPVSGVETPSTVLGNYQCRLDCHKSDLYGWRVKRAGFNKKHEKGTVFSASLFHVVCCFTSACTCVMLAVALFPAACCRGGTAIHCLWQRIGRKTLGCQHGKAGETRQIGAQNLETRIMKPDSGNHIQAGRPTDNKPAFCWAGWSEVRQVMFRSI